MIAALVTLGLMVLPAAAFQKVGISDAGPSKRLVKMTKPLYPPAAKAAGIQGTVQLEAVIAKDGTVKKLRTASGPPELIPAAVDAVKDWIYEPVTKDGQPVEVIVTVTINFNLQNDTTSTQSEREAIEVRGSLQESKLVNKVSPAYPPDAKAAGLEGSVRLRVMIGKDGMLKEVRNVAGPPPLIESAVDAVRQWIWKPTTLDGAAVAVITEIMINFRLAR